MDRVHPAEHRDTRGAGILMRLKTPRDIHEKKFTTHRFKEGYDMDEVDSFMDDVEDTVRELGDASLDLLEMIQRRWSGNEDKKHQAGVLEEPGYSRA